MRELLKNLISRIPVDFVERSLAYSIIFEKFPSLDSCRTFVTREELWDHCLFDIIGIDEPITFVEFGVWEGYSIKYFAKKNKIKNSLFFGLDSFEGLPEDWAHLEKSHFSTGGILPKIHDDRISFIKGWFQDTFSELQKNIEKRVANFIVHYDADLYSSTLFCLTRMDCLKRSYFAIFDEFPGHESRALYNYLQSNLADVEFLGKTVGKNGRPVQVLCRIHPR
jgi:O-methyltransferase